jgi:hypothetical protein
MVCRPRIGQARKNKNNTINNIRIHTYIYIYIRWGGEREREREEGMKREEAIPVHNPTKEFSNFLFLQEGGK